MSDEHGTTGRPGGGAGLRLAVMGAGDVGRALADLAPSYGHRIVALADSTSAAVAEAGEVLDADAALARKARDGRVGDADHEALLNAPYDALVEASPTTLGDAEPGMSHVRAALERDRHVVLANKGPPAERFGELRALEAESGGVVRLEATVAAAIPILSTIEDCGPRHVTAARGVLNGTANFVLSRMAAEGLDYEHVLAEAQDLGVAEADPAFDVDGVDAALKGVILANVLRTADEPPREALALADAEVEGIRHIRGTTLALVAEDGATVRLVAEATRDGVRVGPRLVLRASALAVSGTENVAQLETRSAGPLKLGGRGAGGSETATAILADVGRLPGPAPTAP